MGSVYAGSDNLSTRSLDGGQPNPRLNQITAAPGLHYVTEENPLGLIQATNIWF